MTIGLVVDTSAPAPSAATSDTSPDGMLTVTLDVEWAGAEIIVDASGQSPSPRAIRVYRRGPSGTVAVRGADPNLSPGGLCPAYDHEAPLGVTSAWWAVAVDPVTGAESDLTGEASLVIPIGAREAWLKSIANPSASRTVEIVSFSEGGRGSRTTMHPVMGRASRVPSLSTPRTVSGTVRLRTRTETDYEDLERLLDSGTLLLQASNAHGLPRGLSYVVRLSELPVGRPGSLPGWELREWDADMEAVSRPSTTGSVMRTPAVSYATLPYSSWTELGASNPTYLDLIDG